MEDRGQGVLGGWGGCVGFGLLVGVGLQLEELAAVSVIVSFIVIVIIVTIIIVTDTNIIRPTYQFPIFTIINTPPDIKLRRYPVPALPQLLVIIIASISVHCCSIVLRLHDVVVELLLLLLLEVIVVL